MASLAEHTITNKLGDDLHDVLEEKGVSQEVLDGVDHILDYPDIIKEQLELKGSSDGSKTYTGEETAYIKVNVDNINNTISALLNEKALDEHFADKFISEEMSGESQFVQVMDKHIETQTKTIVVEQLEELSNNDGINAEELDW